MAFMFIACSLSLTLIFAPASGSGLNSYGRARVMMNWGQRWSKGAATTTSPDNGFDKLMNSQIGKLILIFDDSAEDGGDEMLHHSKRDMVAIHAQAHRVRTIISATLVPLPFANKLGPNFPERHCTLPVNPLHDMTPLESVDRH